MGLFRATDDGSAVVWRSGLAVDADGSPRAYHPERGRGLDWLANAGKPGNWWGLACGPDGSPVVQGESDPAPGHYVSTTSLVNPRYLRGDPRRYVDSEAVQYLTMTRAMPCRLGDLGVAMLGGKLAFAVVADVGPRPGEGSIATCRALGAPSDPKRGGVSSPVVSFCVMRGTALAAPWPRESYLADAEAAFAAWGGAERLARELRLA